MSKKKRIAFSKKEAAGFKKIVNDPEFQTALNRVWDSALAQIKKYRVTGRLGE